MDGEFYMTLKDKRHALMAKYEPPWEQIEYPLSNFSSATTTVRATISGNTIQIKTTSAGKYKSANGAFSTQAGYEYRVVCDIAVSDGIGRIASRNSSDTIRGFDTGSYTVGGHIDIVFQHNAEISKIGLFCTFGTSEDGDVTYTGFTLYRRPKNG